MRVDVDRAVDRRERALRAVVAAAHAATCADRGGRLLVGEVEALGVDGAVGMSRFAAQADGERLALVKERALAFILARQNELTPVSVH